MPKNTAKIPRTKAADADAFGQSLSVAEAAKLAGVGEKTIHRLRHEFAYRRIGKRICISERAFMAWLGKNTFGRGAR